MVKGKPRHRSVGVQQQLKLAFSKVPAPVVKLDLGIDWPVSFQSNLTEPGGKVGTSLLGQHTLRLAHALPTTPRRCNLGL